MEPLKHECGIAMIRLLRPLEYYHRKYGSYTYGLNKLYLMMEKQHNRGQEGAGVGVVKLHAQPGHEYVFRERALGTQAISEIFDGIYSKVDAAHIADMSPRKIEEEVPFLGEIYMGHLRYSTTGKGGMSYVHPFLRRNNWKSRNLLMCGNFNMTNVDEVFDEIIRKGQHPRLYSDTIVLLEQMGYALDRENHRLYREFRDTLVDPQLETAIEDNMNMRNVLMEACPGWDGGYAVCAVTGSGDMAVLRDAHGIRPAFYYRDDEIVVVASERPVIQTAFNLPIEDVHELTPGQAIIVNKAGKVQIEEIMPEGTNQRCSFERIYFSRGSDADIYRERKQLGRQLVPDIMRHIDNDLQHTIFSFIPNTAEVAFYGMVEGLEDELNKQKIAKINIEVEEGNATPRRIAKIMAPHVRMEKLAIKDIKLRTFIAEGASRDDLATHVYDVTYGCVENGVDNLAVIDDSIVRGTTLRRSIINILDRLHPRKIIIISSSPQVRYPDYYGIDMSRLGEFIAFRAAVSLLHKSGRWDILADTYRHCREELAKPSAEQVNCVKAIYEPFTDQEISDEIVNLVRDPEVKAEVSIIYQTIEGLHQAIPDHPGDWYFSGNYPTPGGNRLVNRAYINFYEGRDQDR